MRIERYNEGGFDASKPNNNIAEVIEIDDPVVEPTAEDRLNALLAALADARSLADVRAAAEQATNG